MFLDRRTEQAESFDADMSPKESDAAHGELGRLNALFKFSHPFVLRLPRMVPPDRCKSLSILDVGAGDGSLGRRLTDWASNRGWKWTVTNLDLRPCVRNNARNAANVAGSAISLPFADGAFDVVVASQMTHHLNSDAEIAAHFREGWRVARTALLLSDLHRNAGLYCLLWITTRIVGSSPTIRADALTSVRRAFRRPEWRQLASQAGIQDAKVWLYAGTRIMLEARKSP